MNSTPADGTIKLVNAVSTAGFRLSIAGSNAGSANSNGGNILLTPGAPTGTGQKGIVDIAGNITVQGPAWGPGNQGVVALGDSNNYMAHPEIEWVV
jgi:hypothetical protein